uniref:Uncharacterized protein n=1 Tax=Setaria italica TaxID=4555 RepID=K4ANE2_SETIT
MVELPSLNQRREGVGMVAREQWIRVLMPFRIRSAWLEGQRGRVDG